MARPGIEPRTSCRARALITWSLPLLFDISFVSYMHVSNQHGWRPGLQPVQYKIRTTWSEFKIKICLFINMWWNLLLDSDQVVYTILAAYHLLTWLGRRWIYECIVAWFTTCQISMTGWGESRKYVSDSYLQDYGSIFKRWINVHFYWNHYGKGPIYVVSKSVWPSPFQYMVIRSKCLAYLRQMYLYFLCPRPERSVRGI